MSSIELKERKREGGPNLSEVIYWDFVVDGVSLFDRVEGDFASCFGWFLSEQNDKAIRRLLLIDDADFPDNRRSVYVCPECGDLGCGAISVVIEKMGNSIVWRDFGYQNNYDENIDLEAYSDIGPFSFNMDEYASVIKQASILNHER